MLTSWKKLVDYPKKYRCPTIVCSGLFTSSECQKAGHRSRFWDADHMEGSVNLRNLATISRPHSQGPVQPSPMERACEGQVSMTDKDIYIPRFCPTSSHGQGVQRRRRSCVHVCARERVCVCTCACVCVHARTCV